MSSILSCLILSCRDSMIDWFREPCKKNTGSMMNHAWSHSGQIGAEIDSGRYSSFEVRHIAESCSLGEHGINDSQKLVGSGKDRFFERKPILGSFLVVVSETVIELDNPDGHIPDHPPEMTITTLGNLAMPLMLAGLVYGRIKPRHGNELFVIVELLDITSHLN